MVDVAHWFFLKTMLIRNMLLLATNNKKKEKKWEYAAPTMDDVEHSSKRTTQACQGAK